MARGDVRIAVTLACEECKRRNYQTNKSKRNNPDRITLRKYCSGAAGTRATGRPASAGAAVARDRQRAKQRKARRAGRNPGPHAGRSRIAPTCRARSSMPRARSTSSTRRSSPAPTASEDADDATPRTTSDRARSRPIDRGELPPTSDIDEDELEDETSRTSSTTEPPAGGRRRRGGRARRDAAATRRARPRRGGNRAHRLPRASLGRAPARPVARPPSGRAGDSRRAGLRGRRRRLPRPGRRVAQEIVDFIL